MSENKSVPTMKDVAREAGVALGTVSKVVNGHVLVNSNSIDMKDYPIEAYEAGVKHALMVRETIPWCEELPEEIFADYVFYPRINTEDYEFG